MKAEEAQQISRFISVLESALNAHDAVEYNRHFDDQVSWGNPNGGVVRGIKELMRSTRRFSKAPCASRSFNTWLKGRRSSRLMPPTLMSA